VKPLAKLRAHLLIPAFSLSVLCGAALAEEALDARVARIEQQGLVELLTRLEQLQMELQQLRGQIEEQGYQQEDRERRAREQYLDLDRRLRALEQRAASPVPTPDGAAPELPNLPLPAPHSEPPPVTDVPPPVPSGNEQADYQHAIRLLKLGRYDEAKGAIESFLHNYPQGEYADNAQYWLGETLYVMRDTKAALAEFRKVVDTYPASGKIPDALLKIGFIHADLEEWAQAREALSEVTTRHPDSSAARLASERLERLRAAGH
jgi:tol-pal system protein YbgF